MGDLLLGHQAEAGQAVHRRAEAEALLLAQGLHGVAGQGAVEGHLHVDRLVGFVGLPGVCAAVPADVQHTVRAEHQADGRAARVVLKLEGQRARVAQGGNLRREAHRPPLGRTDRHFDPGLVVGILVPQDKRVVLCLHRRPQWRVHAQLRREGSGLAAHLARRIANAPQRHGNPADPDVLLVVGVGQPHVPVGGLRVALGDAPHVLGAKVLVPAAVALGGHVPGDGRHVPEGMPVLPRHRRDGPAVLPVGGGVVHEGVAAIGGLLPPDLPRGGADGFLPGNVAPGFALVVGHRHQALLVHAQHFIRACGVEGQRLRRRVGEQRLVEPLLLVHLAHGRAVLEQLLAGGDQLGIPALPEGREHPGVLRRVPGGLVVDQEVDVLRQRAVRVNPPHRPAHAPAVAGRGAAAVMHNAVEGQKQQHPVLRIIEAHALVGHGEHFFLQQGRAGAFVLPGGHLHLREGHDGLIPVDAVRAGGQHGVAGHLVLVHGVGQVLAEEPAVGVGQHGGVVVRPADAVGPFGVEAVAAENLPALDPAQMGQCPVLKAHVRPVGVGNADDVSHGEPPCAAIARGLSAPQA